MQSQTSKVVYERHISCDGGGGALGHPKIYLEIKSGVDEILKDKKKLKLSAKTLLKNTN